MDTISIVTATTAVVAALLLALVAAAEANVIPLAHRRLRGVEALSLIGLLRTYVRERQRILRHLRSASTIAVVSLTASLVILINAADWRSAIVAGVIAVLAVSLLRSASRIAALSRPDAAVNRLAGPVRLAQFIFGPLSWLLSAPVTVPMRAMGLTGTSERIDPAEELVGTIEASDDDAVLTEERRMIRGVLEMSDQTVRELMTPRTDVVAISTEASFSDVMRLVSRSGKSRIPLYEGALDHIVGVIYAKDLLAYVQNGNVTPRLADIARPPYIVPETKHANELLVDLRRERVHLAIAVDEYGGVSGLITVEDLIEEIVGAIDDEYDTAAIDVQRISDDEVVVDGGLTIDELNEIFQTEIDSEDFDTVGGLVVTELGRLAVPGDEVVVPDLDDLADGQTALRLRVATILGRRIKRVNVQRYVPAAERESEPESASEAEAV